MNEKITAFLDEVCNHIKYKKIHNEIRAELTEHILELSGKIGIEQAILQMGESFEVGEKLNKQHKPKTEWSIIGLVALIVSIGCGIMFISSKYETYEVVNFEKYLLFAIIGTVIMIVIYFFDYTKLKKLAFPVYLFAFALLLLTLFSGAAVNGRRILVNGMTDYSILLFLIAFAGFIEESYGKGGLAMVRLIAIGIISMLPVMAIPKVAGCFIMLIVYAVLLITAVSKNHFGGNRKLQFISLGGLGFTVGSIFIFAVLSELYRFDRLISFLSKDKNSSWIHIQLGNLLSRANWLGKATETAANYTGKKYSVAMELPAVAEECVLANIIATLGWAVGITLIVIIALFIIRMFITTKRIRNDYGFYLSLASCTVLSAQFIISILLNFNLFPYIGVSMPFVSYSGAGYAVSMAYAGIILSVWRMNNLVSQTKKAVEIKTHKFITVEDGKLIINLKIN